MGQFFCQQCGHRTMDLAMICPNCEPKRWERHKLRNKKIDELAHLYQQEREARERAENRLSRLLGWITQGQMSGYNYTYEAMHQAVESAFIEAVRQQEERAEQAERERDELLEVLREILQAWEAWSDTNDDEDNYLMQKARRVLGGE